MTTKLKIDLAQGILEVEGSETFVKAIYRDFKAQFLGEEKVEPEEPKPKRRRRSAKPQKTRPGSQSEAKPKEAVTVSQPDGVEKPSEPEPAPVPAEPPKPKKESAGPAYTFVTDLELGATAEHPALVEFMDSKLPITNEERNLVFLYYLEHIIKRKPIKIDDVYTCYQESHIRTPLNIEHSLKLTAKYQDWIEIADSGEMRVTRSGQKYVENQLPKKTR